MLEFTPNIIDHILIFIIGILLPLRSVKAQDMLKKITFTPIMKSRLYLGNSLSLWIMAGILAGINWFMGRPPVDFGLHWPPASLNSYAFWALGGFVLLYGFDLVYETSFPKTRKKTITEWQENIPFLPVSFGEFKQFIPLALTAGICEEFIFRGYFITYFYNLVGQNFAYLAIIIPTLIFALVHQYQGKKAMIKIFFMAIFFGLIYYFTGSLWQVMLLHFFVDLIGGFLAWQLLKNAPAPSKPVMDDEGFQEYPPEISDENSGFPENEED